VSHQPQPLPPHLSRLPEGLTVRPLETPQTQALVKIDEASFPEPWAYADFHGFRDAGGCVDVACVPVGGWGGHKTRPVGYVAYEAKRSTVRVKSLAVAVRQRSLGIGALLLHGIVRRLSDDGWTRVLLDIDAREVGACGWLARTAARVLPDGRRWATRTVLIANDECPTPGGVVLECIRFEHRVGVLEGCHGK
jgi:ribosomal protein S18 acetylase RimI-like enzyme